MTSDSIASFLEQFETSRRNVQAWPEWMKDARVVAAALPQIGELALSDPKPPADTSCADDRIER